MGNLCFGPQGDNRSGEYAYRRALAAAKTDVVQLRSSRSFYSRYQIVRPLGQGGYSKVIECAWLPPAAPKHFAVKVVAKVHVSTDAVLRELAVSRLLADHPAAIKVYEMYEDESYFFLVMELCRGGELFERIVKKGHFSERDAARYLRTIIEFLAFAHSKGIAHLDLKPENILLLKPAPADGGEDKVQIKVIDYGCSSYCPEGVTLTLPYGSPLYAAPEVLHCKYDKSADIWSLGVISYLLFVGYPPFYGATDKEIIIKAQRGFFSLDGPGWDAVSEQAKAFVAAMLRLKPGSRPSAQQLLQHPWMLSAQHLGEDLDPKLLDRLRAFRRNSRFKRLALVLMAGGEPDSGRSSNSTEAECENASSGAALLAHKLRAVFESIDEDHNGSLDFDEFCRALTKAECKALDPQELRALFDAADCDNTGLIDYAEFLAVMGTGAAAMARNPTLAAEAVMRALDTDGDGYVTAQDLAGVMHPGASLAEAASIVRQVDVNGDGRIDVNEIRAAIQAT
ncbi:hypothetical protein HYH03_014778 [Edaphochlamys debaryana]|uniref:Calcium-dependent protein kinase n=1 Tax=Edaphochlamys debaryana TaxID=47281 RepID=A0A836BRW6_9CHLO|nr:hypothetical protein HYH03_014778 [Edaphochlamys debaryana]|eukprot:KAG2486610.1 hypothetical protein HYH03_014778 [Edaphochlamys debaryana]